MTRAKTSISGTRARGFSLVELAVVLGATAIVGALGASAYRTHVARSQVSNSIAVAGDVQQNVARSFAAAGEPPANRVAAGLSARASDEASEFVDFIEVIDGRIDLHFGDIADQALAGRILSLTPFETVAQQVVWVCGNSIPGPGLKPLGFAAGDRQSVQILTTIEARYLPANCR